MEKPRIIEWGDRQILLVDEGHEFTFTLSRGKGNNTTYTKKIEDLDKREQDLVIAETIKNQSNGK